MFHLKAPAADTDTETLRKAALHVELTLVLWKQLLSHILDLVLFNLQGVAPRDILLCRQNHVRDTLRNDQGSIQQPHIENKAACSKLPLSSDLVCPEARTATRLQAVCSGGQCGMQRTFPDPPGTPTLVRIHDCDEARKVRCAHLLHSIHVHRCAWITVITAIFLKLQHEEGFGQSGSHPRQQTISS